MEIKEKIKKICILPVAILISLYCSCQTNPTVKNCTVTFEHLEVYDLANGAILSSVEPTNDSNYVACGWVYSRDTYSADIIIMKFNCDGETLWTKKYGDQREDYAKCIQETSDKGFIIAGLITHPHSVDSKMLLIKTDSTGLLQWTKQYATNARASFVRETSDGCFMVTGSKIVGSKHVNILLLKVAKEGDSLWAYAYGGQDNAVGLSNVELPNGHLVIAGNIVPIGEKQWDFYIAQTDSKGKKVWEKQYGGQYPDLLFSVKQTTNQGFVLTGKTLSYGAGLTDIYVIRTDKSGNIVWAHTYGSNKKDAGLMIFETLRHNFVIVGYRDTLSQKFSREISILKIGSDGKELYEYCIGLSNNSYEPLSACLTYDGNIIVVGKYTSLYYTKPQALICTFKFSNHEFVFN